MGSRPFPLLSLRPPKVRGGHLDWLRERLSTAWNCGNRSSPAAQDADLAV
jgi:hypothetical protein